MAGAGLGAGWAAGGWDAAGDGIDSGDAEGATMGPKVTWKEVQQARCLDQVRQGPRIENSLRPDTFGQSSVGGRRATEFHPKDVRSHLTTPHY